MTPIAWCGNVYLGLSSGKDIWGSEMNALDWISLSVFPLTFISKIDAMLQGGQDIIPFIMDISNGTYKEIKNDE